jgi:hypothetical protein
MNTEKEAKEIELELDNLLGDRGYWVEAVMTINGDWIVQVI